MIEIKVPELGESIHEVQILKWMVAEGDYVGPDDDLLEVETEKASQVIPAPAGGILKSITAAEGEFAKVGDTIGSLEKAEQPAAVACEHRHRTRRSLACEQRFLRARER